MNSNLLRGAAFAASLLLSTFSAHATLFGDDEARKAILELRDTITESQKLERERLDEISARIDRLQAQIEGLQHGISESTNRFDSLTNDVARLRGTSEQLANDVATLQRHERETSADFDQRLRKVEPQPVTIDGRTASVDRDEQSGFETALGQFRSSDYRGAINSLRTFLGRYPQSVYAPAAQFWLGSSLYAVKDFPGAVAAQQSLVERFPESPRVPDALLGIGASQVELNDRKGARATFARIGNDFPDTEAARLAKERLSAMGPDDRPAGEKKRPKAEPKAEPKG